MDGYHCGMGGGNRAAAAHIKGQHAEADSASMVSKPAKSSYGVSSSTAPRGKPSNAGSPTSGKPPSRPARNPMRPPG